MIKSSKPQYNDDDLDFESRIVSSEFIGEDGAEGGDNENALRPKSLSEYVGLEVDAEILNSPIYQALDSLIESVKDGATGFIASIVGDGYNDAAAS